MLKSDLKAVGIAWASKIGRIQIDPTDRQPVGRRVMGWGRSPAARKQEEKERQAGSARPERRRSLRSIRVKESYLLLFDDVWSLVATAWGQEKRKERERQKRLEEDSARCLLFRMLYNTNTVQHI